MLLPAQLGQLLLGASWAGARSVLPWTIVDYVGTAICVGFFMGFQARSQGRMVAMVSLAIAVQVVLGAAVVATFARSANDFAVLIGAVSVVNAVGAAVLFLRSTPRRRTPLST